MSLCCKAARFAAVTNSSPDYLWAHSCPGQGEAVVVPGRDIVALLSVGDDSADIGHEDARIARDVGPGVPGPGQGIERGVRHLDVRNRYTTMTRSSCSSAQTMQGT